MVIIPMEGSQILQVLFQAGILCPAWRKRSASCCLAYRRTAAVMYLVPDRCEMGCFLRVRHPVILPSREKTMQPGMEKICSLELLAAKLEEARGAGGKVVLCHGVFDLLHVGHIKHLRAAAELGDVLVVTVTPDCFVDKGPHRPAFTASLRAEALAALACVDYVAVNRWPTAVETLELLKPDFYVKGAVKGKGPRDHTGAILLEEKAVKAAGGRLHLTEEETWSASTLINRYLDLLDPNVQAYLEEFRSRFGEEDILDYVKRMQNLKILTIGETIIDEYRFCKVMNKANKEPILAAKYLYAEQYPGGMLAINNHLSGFCGGIGCITYLGGEDSREAYVRENLDSGVELYPVMKSGSPTIVKQRFLEEYLGVKLLEVDIMNDDPLSPAEEDRFRDLVAELAPRHDVVIVADYGHGLISEKSIRVICEKAPFLAINVQVNPGNYGFHLVSRYPRADYVTLDEPEARLEMKKQQTDIASIAHELADQMQLKRLLLTRGQKGTLCYDPQQGVSITPVFSTRLVDRTGAGDACLALTAPCAALDAPMEVLGFLGNLAGSMACGVMGNKTFIDPVSFQRGIRSLLK
jgi:rfaE bifunctional protein kinase chain/domain/rfaE bifunctional protein nucleotidyltransferase chain/domain